MFNIYAPVFNFKSPLDTFSIRLQNRPYFFAYSSKREQSKERSGTRLKTESETGERRYGRVRLARFARVILLRHALLIFLLILRKKPTVFTPRFTDFLTDFEKKTDCLQSTSQYFTLIVGLNPCCEPSLIFNKYDY